jgi:MGT family glycosyltransferase
MYMHQEAILGRIATALADLDARAVLLTGPEVDPDELGTPLNIAVRRYVPHAALLKDSSLMVTHGGMGTLMAAFAAGVPCLTCPLGRDQHTNATRAAELGVSITLEPETPAAEIRIVAERALASSSLREHATEMAKIIAGYGNGARAVAEVEEVANSGASIDGRVRE